MRILLIEDDQEAARLLAKGLREEGWIADVAHSSESGDKMASVNPYDAIVLDWLLPGRDGIAVCRDLRAGGLHVPILMLTARDAVEDRVFRLNAGADDYRTKPFAFCRVAGPTPRAPAPVRADPAGPSHRRRRCRTSP